jgi:hypothetical protein
MKSKFNIFNIKVINNLQDLTNLFVKNTYTRSDKRIARSKLIDLPTIYPSESVIGIRGK